MREPRNIDSLLYLIKKLSLDESMKVDYIFNNLTKISNLHGLRLTEAEKKILRKFQNKNFGNKMPMDLSSHMKPKFD